MCKCKGITTDRRPLQAIPGRPVTLRALAIRLSNAPADPVAFQVFTPAKSPTAFILAAAITRMCMTQVCSSAGAGRSCGWTARAVPPCYHGLAESLVLLCCLTTPAAACAEA